MAQAVEQALAEKRHLVVEAGTGTGKTLAYLVPVIRAGKRVVMFSLPGAFTPTCSKEHLPGYVARYDILPETVLVLGVRHQREEDYR